MTPIQIKPNIPLTVSLVNPEGVFDFEGGFGLYETTTGQTFILPRPAVVALNTLDPQPGEEIVITKHWSGKRGEKAEWTIALSPNSEKCRAKAETEPSELSEQLERSIQQAQTRKRATARSGVSDAPGWMPGPYSIEHVMYFSDLPGLEGGTFEIGDENRTDNWLGQAQTIEQAQLFAAAPDLYAALEAILLVPEGDETMGLWTAARTALAKARGEKPA